MAQLSPSAVFSPSIARQQQAAAKDWFYIDSWLATKYSGSAIPPFERNADTLKALLALASYNDAADEDDDLLSKVESKALHELREQERNDTHSELLTSFENGLSKDGQAALDALAETSIVLNLPFADPEILAKGITDLQIELFDLEQASDRVASLQRHLERELDSIKRLVEELQSEAYQPSPDLAKQTLDFQRKTKVLAAKLPELRDKVAALSAATGSPKPTVQEIRSQEDKYRDQLVVVKQLEAQVKSYHGLPHDVDLARLELETLRVELKSLTKQRDAMFEGLVERESPRKAW